MHIQTHTHISMQMLMLIKNNFFVSSIMFILFIRVVSLRLKLFFCIYLPSLEIVHYKKEIKKYFAETREEKDVLIDRDRNAGC